MPHVERMQRVPRWILLSLLVAVVAAGILAPRPYAGLAFLAVAAFVGWLLFLTWQRLALPERLLRLSVLTLTVAVAVVRLVPPR